MDPSSPTKTEETAEESAKEEVPVLPSSPFIDSEYEFRAPMFYDFLNPVSDDDDADAFFGMVFFWSFRDRSLGFCGRLTVFVPSNSQTK
jgi:hypothetical protein